MKSLLFPIGLFLLFGVACSSEYSALPESVNPLTPSPIATPAPHIITPTFTPSPTITPVPSSTPTFVPTTTLTPTATSSPSLLEADSATSAPKSYGLSDALSEVEGVRFIGPNTIAYLQWGTVYTHNLSTEQTRMLAGSGDIGSFDWSDTQQQFAIVQNGGLYLLDVNGFLVENLSSSLPVIHPDPEFVKACYWNEMTEDDNLLEYVKWVKWNPEYPQLIFGAANIDDYITHHCGPKIWSADTQENSISEIGPSTGYNPEPQWLNKDTLLLYYYRGGGSHEYYIVDIPTSETILTFGNYAGLIQPSVSGSRLVSTSEQPTQLQVWDISKDEELQVGDFSTNTSIYQAVWSGDERYIVISQEEKSATNRTDDITSTIFVFDTETQQKWQPDYRFAQYIFATWFPDRNEILIFHRSEEGTSTYIANPVDESLTSLRDFPKMRLSSIDWSSTDRYLRFLQDNRSIWLWDNHTTETPFPVYELDTPDSVARFGNFVWSQDDTWLIFTEQVGSSLPDTDRTDIILQALQIPTGQHHVVAVWEIPKDE